MTRIDRDRIEDLGFALWQDMQSAEFNVLMAYKHGAEDCLRKAIDALRKAIDAAEAKLDADEDEAPYAASPEAFALEAADGALMRRYEDDV